MVQRPAAAAAEDTTAVVQEVLKELTPTTAVRVRVQVPDQGSQIWEPRAQTNQGIMMTIAAIEAMQ